MRYNVLGTFLCTLPRNKKKFYAQFNVCNFWEIAALGDIKGETNNQCQTMPTKEKPNINNNSRIHDTYYKNKPNFNPRLFEIRGISLMSFQGLPNLLKFSSFSFINFTLTLYLYSIITRSSQKNAIILWIIVFKEFFFSFTYSSFFRFNSPSNPFNNYQ